MLLESTGELQTAEISKQQPVRKVNGVLEPDEAQALIGAAVIRLV